MRSTCGLEFLRYLGSSYTRLEIPSSISNGRVDGGGPLCYMSIIRNGYVALLNLRETPVALSIFLKSSCRPVEFRKISCHMSLMPKRGCDDFRGLYPQLGPS